MSYDLDMASTNNIMTLCQILLCGKLDKYQSYRLPLSGFPGTIEHLDQVDVIVLTTLYCSWVPNSCMHPHYKMVLSQIQPVQNLNEYLAPPRFFEGQHNSSIITSTAFTCPVSWGCRIHWLHLCRGVRPPPTSVLDMTLNNLMVRFQQCWSFGECGEPFHCHRSQVHSGLEW